MPKKGSTKKRPAKSKTKKSVSWAGDGVRKGNGVKGR